MDFKHHGGLEMKSEASEEEVQEAAPHITWLPLARWNVQNLKNNGSARKMKLSRLNHF